MSRIDDDPAVIRAREAARSRAARDLRGAIEAIAALAADAATTATDTGASAAYLAGQFDRIRKLAELHTADAVDLARAHGVTWDDIGEQLGVDRRNAHRKYGKGKTS